MCIFYMVRHVGDGLYAFWLLVPCRHPPNAVNVQRVRRGPRACVHGFMCLYWCVRVRFNALGVNEYLMIVVRVVWHLCADYVSVRGVEHVYCTFVYREARSNGACCECATSVWCDMLVTAFTRFGCCSPATIPEMP